LFWKKNWNNRIYSKLTRVVLKYEENTFFEVCWTNLTSPKLWPYVTFTYQRNLARVDLICFEPPLTYPDLSWKLKKKTFSEVCWSYPIKTWCELFWELKKKHFEKCYNSNLTKTNLSCFERSVREALSLTWIDLKFEETLCEVFSDQT
jgi:hypothetical protein